MSHGVCLQTWSLQTLLSLTGTISLLAVSLTESALVTVPSCQRKSACSCYLHSRGMIDLSHVPIPNNAPAFKNQSKDIFCEWNPCAGFTDSKSQGACINTKLCKQDLKNDTYTNLGNDGEFFYNSTEDRVIMIYEAGEMHTEISLKCSETTSFEINNAVNKTHLYLTFSTQCACPGRCVKGLSPGSILCIIFFSVAMAYFVVGALYRKTVYQSEGWDMLPQREFWRELPSLIRDGYMFFISPCLGNRVQYTMYQHVPGHNFEEIEETGEDDDDEEYEQR